MQGIKKIEFFLENCEEIEVDGKYIEAFSIDNVKSPNWSDDKEDMLFDNFYIKLSKDADRINIPFGIEDFKTKQTIFERLCYGDITQIQYINNEGNKSFYFHAPYKDEEDVLGAPNLNQTSLIDDNSNLYITIKKDN